MRIMALAILLIGAASAASPAHAQTYGRNFPITYRAAHWEAARSNVTTLHWRNAMRQRQAEQPNA